MTLVFADQVEGILFFLVTGMPVHDEQHGQGDETAEKDNDGIGGQVKCDQE